MPVGHDPLTERFMLPGPWRWLVIVVWSGLPFARIVVFAMMGAAAGFLPSGAAYMSSHVSAGALNAYILIVVLVGTGLLARQLEGLRTLGGDSIERLVRRNGSVVLPLTLAVFLTLLNLGSLFQEFGADAVVGAPLAFGADFVITLLFRIPQATALYASVVALLTVAELGNQPTPGTFPEDRSLGLGAVGELLTTILFAYVAVFIPVLLFGTSGNVTAPRLGEFLIVVGVFCLGLAAMLVATWTTHRRMVTERSRQVDAARARYATAYRRALTDDDPTAGTVLETARLLLEGAESIHEWPFNDRTLRVAGLLLTGVITGIVVRVATLTLGL